MKISALTAATTPLSGAELFPIVQSGNTRRVSLDDLLRSIGNGTAAAPALAPGGDPNTGIYFPAADTIGFVEGGVEVMRIDANGRVGIGTTSPGVNLEVTANAPILRIRANSAGTAELSLFSAAAADGRIQYANTGFAFLRDNGVQMRLDASGNLGIGVTPSAWASSGNIQLQGARGIAFNANAYLYANAFSGAGGMTYVSSSVANLYAMENGSHKWFNAPSGTAGSTITFTQAMTLDPSGRLGIGTSPSAPLHVDAGSGLEYFRGAGNSGAARYFNISASTTTNAGDTHTLAATSATGVLRFATAGSERVRIDSNGNLGVGTTSPQAGGVSIFQGTTGGATVPGVLTLGENSLTVSSGDVLGRVQFYSNDASINLAGVVGKIDCVATASFTASEGQTALTFHTNTGVAGTLTERVRIKSAGQMRYVPLAAAPTTNVEDGDVYYDSGTNKLRVRAGGAWTDLH